MGANVQPTAKKYPENTKEQPQENLLENKSDKQELGRRTKNLNTQPQEENSRNKADKQAEGIQSTKNGTELQEKIQDIQEHKLVAEKANTEKEQSREKIPDYKADKQIAGNLGTENTLTKLWIKIPENKSNGQVAGKKRTGNTKEQSRGKIPENKADKLIAGDLSTENTQTNPQTKIPENKSYGQVAGRRCCEMTQNRANKQEAGRICTENTMEQIWENIPKHDANHKVAGKKSTENTKTPTRKTIPKNRADVQIARKKSTENTKAQPLKKISETKADSIHQADETNKHQVVVAIDFGTVHSGFAFSFKGNEEKIISAKHGGIFQEDRVPTILLLNPNKTVHSFGYNAQTHFHKLSELKRSKFYYFENFKMKIYNESKFNRDMKICDLNGKPLRAMTVFSKAIKHLKDEATNIVHQFKTGLKETDIQWMITIPAISSDSVRQFMREASTDAGIPEAHLQIVLEPEAAALYCKTQKMSKEMYCGFKYLLADLGGGTSDICVHKILDGGKLQEMYRANGEAKGGSDVDECFINMMETLVGKEVWSKFSSTSSSAYVSLVNEFRLKKKDFKSNTAALKLKMENALVHLIHKKDGKSFKDVIDKTKYAGKLRYGADARLMISGEILEEVFKPSVDKIIDKLKDALHHCSDSEIKTILLVGGYSESPYVRERIKSEFSTLRVILVDDARLAVLNGAVAMGWNPRNIIQRRSRYTYGYLINHYFRHGKDLNELKFKVDGRARCGKVFQKIIEKGQTLESGQTFNFAGDWTATEQDMKHIIKKAELYRSTEETPQYCTEEEGCSLVGMIKAKPPRLGWPDALKVNYSVTVGETEFTVKVFSPEAKMEYIAQMDFL
ncbi:heat shock 70 kDa protein 12A-like [Ruditapes philippinarum]|uniref:heat shock 70 kDa protein 12A-like n=1 Tax=Ruditapes philippinarum TaxID=129788 RepID=UPI00295B890F|nr:heat shock 70 kDa protein 12A-like [Ruditapes philippinarum]